MVAFVPFKRSEKSKAENCDTKRKEQPPILINRIRGETKLLLIVLMRSFSSHNKRRTKTKPSMYGAFGASRLISIEAVYFRNPRAKKILAKKAQKSKKTNYP